MAVAVAGARAGAEIMAKVGAGAEISTPQHCFKQRLKTFVSVTV